MKRFISVLMTLTLLTAAFTACGKVENPYKNAEKTESTTSAVQITEKETTGTTLSPAEISRQAEQRSRDAIAKAKSEASSKAESQLAEKHGGTYNPQTAVSSASGKIQSKVNSSAVRSPYESTGDYVRVPAPYTSGLQRAWVVKKFAGIDMRIARIEYGSVTQRFDSSFNSSVANPKTITYRPACTVAVITTDSPTRLCVSKGTKRTTTEALAKTAGAAIAINGQKISYKQGDSAVIRSGSVYKPFSGTNAACSQLVMYKDGHWEFSPLDNQTAKSAVAKGAYNSVSFQDITIQNGRITANYNDSIYHNRTYLGQINSLRYVVMTTECMPIKDAAKIMLAYGVQNAVQVVGGNSSYMYLNGVGNTTGSSVPAIKGLNKLGCLESEWMAQKGLLKSGRGGGPSSDEIDCIYFK